MLFNEPKLLKFAHDVALAFPLPGFSALQRAEIAEMIQNKRATTLLDPSFSALQRAEIAEMRKRKNRKRVGIVVSVLFNEPKLLKSTAI